MSNVSLETVKKLRSMTSAGMVDCKKALIETDGDLEKAVDWLRKKGISSAAKKSDRIAAEGLVVAKISNDKGVLLEVNSETDFVASNDNFLDFVFKVSDDFLNNYDTFDEFANNPELINEKTNAIATIGENIVIRRGLIIKANEGILHSYTHQPKKDNTAGSRAAIINISGDTSSDPTVAEMLAIQVVVSKPLSISKDDLSKDVVQKEIDIQTEIATNSGKNEAVVEKMVQGRLDKFYKEACLLEQQCFFSEDNLTVGAWLSSKNVKIHNFISFELGDGIEKVEANFADEVQKMI